MAPLRRYAKTPETPSNEQLAQNVQQLTQLTQTLGDVLLKNNRGNQELTRQVAGHRPPIFEGQEYPIMLEDWMWTFNKIFEALNCLEERCVDLAAFYLR